VTPRPLIFISAVSRELRSARQLVAHTLTFLGYQPVWQDIFGTETGDLRSMLRGKIDQCKGVVQLVGQSYGAGPPTPDEQFGRVSYTQYEALYGRKRGKKVWYLFIDESFPIDAHEPEPEELRELQAAYRRRLQSDTHVFHPLTSSEALEASVLKLRGDLTRLRRGVKQWAVTVVALLLALTAATVWLVQAQRRQTGVIQKQGEQVNAMQQALVRLADVEAQSKQPGSKASPEEQRASAYGVLERELGLPAGSLAKELPAFALELYNRSDTTPLMRARAAYALGRFDEAEKLSLEVAAQDRQGYESAQRVGEDRRKHAIESYELAGQSAQKRIQYAEAMEHFREAEKLTDRDRNPEDWGEVQFSIANLLIDQGQYGNAENILRSVVGVRNHVLGSEHPDTLRSRNRLDYALWQQAKYVEAGADFRELVTLEEKTLGPEHPDTLLSRHDLANIFFGQGKYAEAEAEYRLILKLREKVLGPEHPDTLRSRNNLAVALAQQGKYAEAEAQDRDVIEIEEKVLGPEHPDTLRSRNNLAAALDQQGKFAEAEAQFREVIKIQEKVLGPEHPETLRNRSNLAVALDEQGKYAEAEAQDRDVIKIQEKVLGPEHPDMLRSRDNLAVALDDQGKYAEAEAQDRDVIKIEEKVLGPEHPDTLRSRNNLAAALDQQGKFAEAEAQFRDVIKIQEKVEGPQHPSTLDSCYYFASGLKRRNRLQEAKEFARRAAEGARKVLGPDHPFTQKYEKLLAELQAKP
jgi:tetratricopeptide (TPR) repeat protein